MAKTVPDSKFQEWEGLDRIQTLVHKMRCIYRELNKDDFGIDGEIELVVPKPDGPGYVTTGSIIKFQAKSGKSYIKSDKPEGFHVLVSKDDLLLWHNSNIPTLFIVYHPDDDRLYWKEVKGYIKQTKNVWQAPYHIEFNKAEDEFSENSIGRLTPIANVKLPKVSWDKKEKLFTNLLKVERLPSIWSSPTQAEDEDEIHLSSIADFPPFFVHNDRLYSCTDFSDSSNLLSSWIDRLDIRLETNSNLCEDADLRRGFVRILNELLQQHLELCDVQYLGLYKRYYFIREDSERLEFKHSWFNIRNNRQAPERITVKKYKYGSDEFWRHLAASLNFKRIGGNWYLQIIPRYYFTNDGVLPFDTSKVGSLTTKIKAKEINYNVLNHVLFWADVLSWPNQIPEKRTKIAVSYIDNEMIRINKMPSYGIAPFSIAADPAIYKDIQPSGQLILMDWEEQIDREDEEDED